jgi:signal peptidase I
MASTPPTPPPLPVQTRTGEKSARGIWIFVGVASFLLILLTFLFVGLFNVPTATMAPAIEAGDQVLVQRLAYLFRAPARGDIIIFNIHDIPALRPAKNEVYVKRVAGLPGERVRIANGALLINGQPVPLRNRAGEIRYSGAPVNGGGFDGHGPLMEGDEVTVPASSYFVLGDNTKKSYDSRFFGFVPAASLRGEPFGASRPSNTQDPCSEVGVCPFVDPPVAPCHSFPVTSHWRPACRTRLRRSFTSI